jgi:hypothetical protein
MDTNTFIQRVQTWKFLTEEMRGKLVSVADELSAEDRAEILSEANKVGANFLVGMEDAIPTLTRALRNAKKDIRDSDEEVSRAEDEAALPNFDTI